MFNESNQSVTVSRSVLLSCEAVSGRWASSVRLVSLTALWSVDGSSLDMDRYVSASILASFMQRFHSPKAGVEGGTVSGRCGVRPKSVHAVIWVISLAGIR
jgi:hypothetical protein